MAFTAQRIAIWTGPVGLLLFGLGISPLAANFLPPPSPGASAYETAQMYLSNSAGIKVGAILIMFGGALICSFAGAISAHMRRSESIAPALTYIQLAAGALATIPFFVGALAMGAAAYRPERSPEIVQMLNDVAWISLVMPVGNTMIQMGAIGLAALLDKSDRPVFPRWLGYTNLWLAVLFLPAAVLLFFKSGPFAWNGLLAFWLGCVAFSIWFVTLCVVMLKATYRPHYD